MLEIPPAEGGSLNGNIVNLWQMPLEDAGPSGADKGKGGKYLILPPGYAGPVPEGYIPLQSDTFGGYALLRSNLKSHGDAEVAKSVAYGKQIKVYPLSQAANPPPDGVHRRRGRAVRLAPSATTRSFFNSSTASCRASPGCDRDRAMIDQLKSIGIEKGKPFSPDAADQGAA